MEHEKSSAKRRENKCRRYRSRYLIQHQNTKRIPFVLSSGRRSWERASSDSTVLMSFSNQLSREIEQGQPSINLCCEHPPPTTNNPINKYLQHCTSTQQSPSTSCSYLSELSPALLLNSSCSGTPHAACRHRHNPDLHARQRVALRASLHRCNRGAVHQIPSTWAIRRINVHPRHQSHRWKTESTGFTVTWQMLAPAAEGWEGQSYSIRSDRGQLLWSHGSRWIFWFCACLFHALAPWTPTTVPAATGQTGWKLTRNAFCQILYTWQLCGSGELD